MAELPKRLREAAAAHHPDRERMLARMERAMAAPADRAAEPQRWERHSAAPWMRVTAVAAAVAGAIGLGGLAVGAVTGEGEPAGSVTSGSGSGGSGVGQPAPTGTQATTTEAGVKPRDSASPEHVPTTSGRTPGHSTTTPPAGPSHTATTTPPQSPPAAPVTGAPSGSGGVSCTGTLGEKSNPFWTESKLTLTTERALTSLTVELRVARTAGVTSTGSYSSVPGQAAPAVTTEGDDLVYRWTLNADQTLDPGTYTFAGQFNHDGGDRDTGGDHFSVTGGGPGGPAVSDGGF